MKETDHSGNHEPIWPSGLLTIPAQFRPSSQLAWRMPIVIATIIHAASQDTPPPFRAPKPMSISAIEMVE